jgi:plastocyanin
MVRRRLARALAIAAVGAAALAFGGCGGEEEAAPSGGGGGGEAAAQVLRISADPGGALSYDKSEYTAPAGTLTIEFENPASIPHAVELEGEGVEQVTEEVTKGSATLEVELEPGEYELYCPVGNHADEGMVSTLTVR